MSSLPEQARRHREVSGDAYRPLSDQEAEWAAGLACDGESLRNGMWPRSSAVWMAALYVAIFIIRPWEELLPWLSTIHFERLFAIAMITVVIATRGMRLSLDRQTVAVLSFLSCLGISGICAFDTELAATPFYEYFTLVVFYIVLLSAIRTPYELIFMVTGYVVTMGVYLSKSHWEHWVHGAHRHNQGVIRMVGIESTFGGPNALAMSIVVSLPMLLFLYRIRNDFCRHWPAKWRKLFNRGLLAYLVLALSSILLTNSRSGMLSAVLFVVLAALQGRRIGRKLKYAAIGCALLGCLWLLAPQDTKNRFQTIWDPSLGPKNAQVSAEGRIEGFHAGMEMFDRFPITGVGIGNFTTYRARYVDGVPLQAHNLPGQLLGEAGMVGGLGFLLLLGAILLNCRATKVAARGQADSTLNVLSQFAIAAKTSIILLLFTGLFGHNVYRFNWLWLAAFCLLAAEFARRQSTMRKSAR